MSNINDQLSERTLVFCIKAANLSARTFAKAAKAYLDYHKKTKASNNMSNKGKQTVKQLTRQGQGVSNIEINARNIKSFESIARKYGVDFAVKKDKSEFPPKWLVFFKARDADALTAAFKEFTAREARRRNGKKSILITLSELIEKVKNQAIDKEKNRTHGGHEL